MTTARITTTLFFALWASLNLVQTSTLQAENWPQFRGPRADGTSSDTSIPTTWSDTENLKWKLKLPGAGFSSPIVFGKHVFVTAYSGRGDNVTRFLLCVDRATGDEIWRSSTEGVSDGGEPGFAYHGQSSHTPICDGERVYVMFGSSGVKAFDLEGNELWHQDVGNERNARFGTASSPVLYNDLLIVTAGAESESIRAFNKKTGEEAWKSEAASLSGTYSTPLITKNSAGEDEMLLSVQNEVWSFDPKSGKFKWYAETPVDTAACPSLVASDGVAYVVGGRRGGRAAIRLDGSGESDSKSTLWSETGGSYVPSPVLHKGHLYWVNDRGIATCVDAETGEQVAQKRIGGQFYASVVLIGDKLYAVSRFDGTHVLSATPELTEIAHNTLSDDSDTSGSPAVSDGQLFLRSDQYLYCIEAE